MKLSETGGLLFVYLDVRNLLSLYLFSKDSVSSRTFLTVHYELFIRRPILTIIFLKIRRLIPYPIFKNPCEVGVEFRLSVYFLENKFFCKNLTIVCN